MAEASRAPVVMPERRSTANLPPANGVLKHYERRSITSKALFWGSLVGIVGFCLDYVFKLLRLPWLRERAFENLFEAAIFTFLVWALLKAREKQLQRRFKEVGYLNHHIRNSLTIIELAEGSITEPVRHSEMVKGASSRIRRCVERISRDEDCEINEKSPQEP